MTGFAVLSGARIPHPVAGPHVCVGGPSWIATVINPSDRYQGIAKNGDTYVATGRGRAGTTPSNTSISVDRGQTWSVGGTIPNVGNGNPFSLRAGNNRFVAYVGGSAAISTDNGVSWTVTALSLGTSVRVLAFGNGLFAYLCNDNTTKSSATGVALASHATPAQGGVLWWNPVMSWWVLLEAAGVRTWTSPDLITWTQRGNMPRNTTGIPAERDVAQLGNTIVCGYSDATPGFLLSTDGGVTWGDSSSIGASTGMTSVIAGNGVFIAVRSLGGNTLVSSDGGVTWMAGPLLTMAKTWYVVYDGLNNYLAVGSSGADDTVANLGVC